LNRRQWVLGGAGAAAAAAGLGWQLRHDSAPPVAAQAPTQAPGASASASAPASPEDALWQAKFTQPDGQLLALSSWRGKPIVLNFWATWCPPCLKEMPEIDRFAKQFMAQGGQVLGLAVDNPSAVAAYLARTPVSYTIGLAGFDGTELSRQLGNSNGGLPFTVALHRDGRLVHRRLGETSFAELTAWALTLG
jgi:thiol-disulfide isomerase/thioredoxin